MTPDERAEITKLIGVYADETRSQIQFLAENMDARFEKVDARLDKMDTRLDRFEHEMHREFAEVRGMIKFSYADLDRRLTTLEAGHENVTSRLSLLEAKLAS